MSSRSVATRPILPLGLRRSKRHSQTATLAGPVRDKIYRRLARATRPYIVGVFALYIITVIYRQIPLANVTTVGFTFLLAILIAAAVSGFGPSVLMSLAALLLYDYYFIPPINQLNITDPQDWIALAAFVITSLVGSTLSFSARRRTRQARRQRLEAEQLYDLSQRLLSAADSLALCNSVPGDVVDAFGVKAAALYLADAQTVVYSPSGSSEIDADRLKTTLLHNDVQVYVDEGLSFIPLRMGFHEIGSVGIMGTAISLATLESLGSLITIAIERARAIEQLGKIEALRENERLKTALLDAITHEFRTPLTAMKLSVTGMLSDLQFDREQCRGLLAMINEGCDRIDDLVGEVSEMSRLESGEMKLDIARHTVAELIEAAVSDCKAALGARTIEHAISNQDLPIRADLFWATKILVHLIKNANLYSSPGKPIAIRTETKDTFVFFTVADQGPGIDPSEVRRIFDKFYRGREHRCRVQGTGMGLPIAKAITEAHGGAMSVTSKAGEGSVFTFSLPIDRSLN